MEASCAGSALVSGCQGQGLGQGQGRGGIEAHGLHEESRRLKGCGLGMPQRGGWLVGEGIAEGGVGDWEGSREALDIVGNGGERGGVVCVCPSPSSISRAVP